MFNFILVVVVIIITGVNSYDLSVCSISFESPSNIFDLSPGDSDLTGSNAKYMHVFRFPLQHKGVYMLYKERMNE